jgi:sugar/nucleoside kinase (ribokinase family)
MRVNVVGDALIDLNFSLPKEYVHRYTQTAKIELPFGQKLTAAGYSLDPGGGGANLAVGLKRAGFTPYLQTGFATDSFGDYLRAYFQAEDINTQAGELGSQTTLSVILRAGGERTIVTGRPSGSYLPRTFPKDGWIHLGPLHGDIDDFATTFLAHQVKTGQEVSLNPSMESIEARSRGLVSLLKTTSVFIANKLEALLLARVSHRTEMKELLQAVGRLGPKVVCITDGENGAYVLGDKVTLFAPALRTKNDRLDATGAGDAFATGFLAGYLGLRDDYEGEQLLRHALAYGISNSASVISEVGAHAGLLSMEELKQDAPRVRVRALE